MRTRILHIICRRCKPPESYIHAGTNKNKKNIHSFLETTRLFVIVVVSFDNCPGESRGDFLKKNNKKRYTF